MGTPTTDEEKKLVDEVIAVAKKFIKAGKKHADTNHFDYKGKLYKINFTVEERV